MIGRDLPLTEYLFIGCKLGLDAKDVERIYVQHHANNINVMPKILLSWRDTRRQATAEEKLEELLACLFELKLNAAAENLKDQLKHIVYPQTEQNHSY